MKTILSMAALALIMAGCSNEDDNVVINNGNLPQEIKIYQSVQGLPSKAAIGPGDKVSAMILINDGDNKFDSFTPRLKNTLKDDNTFADATDRANATVGTFNANVATGQAIALSTKLYYSTEKSTEVYVKGIAPNGDIENAAVKFSQDGLQDVMYAEAVSAGSETTSKTSVLDFAHKTTQLKFAAKITRVKDGEWKGAAVSIQSIQIHKAELPLSMNIADGAVNWATAVDHFSVPMSNQSPLAEKVGTDVSQPVMMRNGTNITIDVTMRVGSEDKKFTNLPVLKDQTSENLTTVIGHSHLVTLNIAEPVTASGVSPIAPTATVQAWVSGDAGSVEIK